jgi:type II secretory pathway pseudopilin PulG
LIILIGLAMMIIAMGIAAPKMAQAIRRDRETEMIHRGVQYARAIKKFYKKFGRYPTSIDQLKNTNNIRFLRKEYKDPMSADGKWRLVRFGEVQLGQQGGGVLGGAGGTTGGAASGGTLPPIVGGALGEGSSGGQQTPPPQQQQQPQGNPSSMFGQSGQPGGRPGGMFADNPSSPTGAGGQVFGGGAILGVASMSDKKGIHEFDKKSRYNQWLFVYDPTQDRGQLITGPYNPKAFVGQPPQVGTPAGQIGQPQPGGLFGNSPAPGQPSGGQPESNPKD